MTDKINKTDIKEIIDLAIKEDIGDGDVTSESIFSNGDISNAKIISKDNGIFCGGDVVQYVYEFIDPGIDVIKLVNDGDIIEKETEVIKLKGSNLSLLAGERVSLNFIQRMSGIATRTSLFVSVFEGTGIKVLDTRKTLPGFRMLDKYSVKKGGGTNHRMGLFDMVMIKDNHIKAAGSIGNAVKLAREKYKDKFLLEVEVAEVDEVIEAVESDVDIIMLDNMTIELMKKSIGLINGRAKIEVSGNIDEKKIRNIGNLKIDYVSIGALTHSVRAFDLSMKFY